MELGTVGAAVGVPVVFLKHLPSDVFDGRPIPESLEYVELDADYARDLEEHGQTDLMRSDLVFTQATDTSAGNPHPSVRGHRLIATGLHRELVARGVIARVIAARSE